MARDIPQGKPPSVTMIDIKPKGAPDKPPAMPTEGEGDTGSSFQCPECGASLTVESKPQEAAEGESGMGEAGGKGGY